MRKLDKNIDVIIPKEQLNLYGYDTYFETFAKLYQNRKLPYVSLISGPKGLGKSTFVYHFINYLLSCNESNAYIIDKKIINPSNKTFKLITSNLHPNFFSIDEKVNKKNITVEETRNLIIFLNKSTYQKNLKFILIDNAENLNISSSNSLLKTLEDYSENTYFFIIYNNLLNIQSTIRSRSIEFKIFFNFEQKNRIFNNIKKSYNELNNINNIFNYLSIDTPGNLLKYCLFLKDSNIENEKSILNYILFFMEKYNKDKYNETLTLVSFFIEKFYNHLVYIYPSKRNNFFFNRSRILKKINLLKKLNLDEKNIFLNIENILLNETK